MKIALWLIFGAILIGGIFWFMRRQSGTNAPASAYPSGPGIAGHGPSLETTTSMGMPNQSHGTTGADKFIALAGKQVGTGVCKTVGLSGVSGICGKYGAWIYTKDVQAGKYVVKGAAKVATKIGTETKQVISSIGSGLKKLNPF